MKPLNKLKPTKKLYRHCKLLKNLQQPSTTNQEKTTYKMVGNFMAVLLILALYRLNKADESVPSPIQ